MLRVNDQKPYTRTVTRVERPRVLKDCGGLRHKVKHFNGEVTELNEKWQKQLSLNDMSIKRGKVAHTISQEKVKADYRLKGEKNNIRQQPEKVTVSQHQVSLRNKSDAIAVGEKADTLQRVLKKEIRQKRLLRKQHKKLKAAYALSQKSFAAELQQEREKNKTLQMEVHRINVSHHEVNQRYETDVVSVRKQVDTLQCHLEREVKSHADSEAEGWRVINSLRAELDVLHQKKTEEINILQQNATDKEKCFERELEELKTQLTFQTSRNLELSAELQAERADYRPPRKIARREQKLPDESIQQLEALFKKLSIKCQQEVPEEKPRMQQESIPDAPALKLQEEAEVSERILPELTKMPSKWNRTQHFLGLTKPQRWKN